MVMRIKIKHLYLWEKKIIVHKSLIGCIMIDFIPGLYLLVLRCIEREDKQCHGSYVTEREKDDPFWESNHTPSAIRADLLS